MTGPLEGSSLTSVVPTTLCSGPWSKATHVNKHNASLSQPPPSGGKNAQDLGCLRDAKAWLVVDKQLT